jgi:hypothetical protein
MTEKSNPATVEADKWLRQMLDFAVREIGERNILGNPLIEVKPEWMLPFALLVGKARDQGDTRSFRWFICGEVALDTLDSGMADSARDAVRSFAMKWQLDATRSSTDDESKALIEAAEQLYPLAEDDRLWPK